MERTYVVWDYADEKRAALEADRGVSPARPSATLASL
jgi:hypothetical protein